MNTPPSPVDPAVATVLKVAFEQIEATAIGALAEVPTRLQRAMRDATTPQERVQLATARRHMLEQRMHLVRSFGLALRGRAHRDPLSAGVIASAMDHAITSLTPDAAVARLLARHTHPTLAEAMKGCQQRIVQALAAERADPLRQPSPEADPVTLREQAALLDSLMRGDVVLPAPAQGSENWTDDGPDNDGPLTQAVRALVEQPLAATATPSNLIRKHRAALEAAATGPTDRLMIGIVVDLFDAVVADKQVPAPVAALLSRLQLPMLRVAMRDPGFFASGTHPVRRFVDRVATLGSARDDLDTEPGTAWLVRVEALVQEIAQGEFQQVALYERKLRELEQVTAEQAQAEVDASPAAAALYAKEAEWQQLSHESARLREALASLPLPSFLKDFLSQPWCQAVHASLDAAGHETADSQRWRRTAVELCLSVLPKRSAEERSRFVASLRGLMSALNDGLDGAGWPAAERSVFFDRLMAAHAASMREPALPQAEYGALETRLAQCLARPAESVAPVAPSASTPSTLPAQVLHASHLEQRFSAEEAERVGLLSEAEIGPAPPPAEARASPCAQFQVGLSYRLLLQTEWQAIRLAYMSPGCNFFMFTHGAKQRRSISMTARMVDKLHAGARFVVAETTPLLDRATAQMRARTVA